MSESPSAIAAAIARDVSRLPVATTPAAREIRRRYSRELARESPAFVLDVVQALLAKRGRTPRFVAYELLAGHRGAMGEIDASLVEQMARGLDGWGVVDAFGVIVAGPAWRDGRVTDRQVMRWARSGDRWRRRLALVATVPLNAKARGGRGDAARTLAVCRLLASDRDDMVVKALSWALRVLSTRDPWSVAKFVKREDAHLAARVRREVHSKLKTGRKVTPR